MPLTSFVGREAELAEVSHLLSSTRLVTLVGAGGIGKTRLAVEVASGIAAGQGTEVALVDLAPLRDATLVPQAVASAVGIHLAGGSPLDNLIAGLRPRHLLMILDNCEHVVGACAELVASMLRRCPELRIVASSREVLGVDGEVIVRVAPLQLPGDGLEETPEAVARSEAAQLFIERARLAQPRFALDEQTAAHVARICRRLDGIPLAIELAAARVRVFGPGEIAARLDDRFRLLVGGSRTAPARHQTLRAAVDWSYELLSDHERHLFERLAVFAGGCTLEATEAVCCDDGLDRSDVLDLLTHLVDRSLVVVEPPDRLAQTRFHLLETLRAYGLERLTERSQAEQLQKRHAAWMLEQAEQAKRAFRGPEQGRWLVWAAREHDNLRAALGWAIARERTVLAQRLAAALWWSWVVHQQWGEGLDWVQRVLALPDDGRPGHERVELLQAAATLSIQRGEVTSSRVVRWLEESLAMAQLIGDDELVLAARGWLGMVWEFGGRVEHAPEVSLAELLAEARRIGHRFGEVRGLVALARRALRDGDLGAATALQEEAIDVARVAGDTWSLASALNDLGDMERTAGRHARAGERYAESLALFAELGLDEQPSLVHNLGYVALAAGDAPLARARFTGALRQFRRFGGQAGMAECLVGLGAVAAAEGRPAEAARLFGAGEAALQVLGTQLWPSNRPDYERWSTRARGSLAAPAFGRASTEGRRWPLELAVTFALEGRRVDGAARRHSLAAQRLTPRELEVARLASQGFTNRQIAEALVISERTAVNHLQHGLEKLHLRSRTQLAARAAELGIQPA
jgi:predicted ATPase/DNA-binding CsgD family transcriptional regulator